LIFIYLLKALLGALDRAQEQTVANDILVHIAILDSVNVKLVLGIEDIFRNISLSQSLQNQLLLVYDSLALKGSKEVDSE